MLLEAERWMRVITFVPVSLSLHTVNIQFYMEKLSERHSQSWIMMTQYCVSIRTTRKFDHIKIEISLWLDP